YMMASLFRQAVRPKAPQVDARPPDERKSGGSQGHQYPSRCGGKVPKLRKQEGYADVEKNAGADKGNDPTLLLGSVGPKCRDDPRRHPSNPEPNDCLLRRHAILPRTCSTRS